MRLCTSQCGDSQQWIKTFAVEYEYGTGILIFGCGCGHSTLRNRRNSCTSPEYNVSQSVKFCQSVVIPQSSCVEATIFVLGSGVSEVMYKPGLYYKTQHRVEHQLVWTTNDGRHYCRSWKRPFHVLGSGARLKMEMTTAHFLSVLVTVFILWAAAGDHAHKRIIISGSDVEGIPSLFACASDHTFLRSWPEIMVEIG